MKTRGHFIKEWRQYRNLTQEQVAERIESTKATVSRIEQARAIQMLRAAFDHDKEAVA